jgi:hypothetical protein
VCSWQRRGFEGTSSWFLPDGNVDLGELGIFIGRCPDRSIKRSLMRLREVLEIGRAWR